MHIPGTTLSREFHQESEALKLEGQLFPACFQYFRKKRQKQNKHVFLESYIANSGKSTPKNGNEASDRR